MIDSGLSASENTLDDLMNVALSHIIEFGHEVVATKGRTFETVGARLQLLNPRARLSRSASRSKPFSSLGELCWYLSGSDDTEQVAYYIRMYREFDVQGRIEGAYGPRMFGTGQNAQIHNVISLLRRKPSSRQAVVQLFDRSDLVGEKLDVPCTCVLQFLVRDQLLCMNVFMRSNDAYLGLPHDIFAFTMIQELVARSLGLEVGIYVHSVGSLHVYERNVDSAKGYLAEGWQHSSKDSMPAMPPGDPWPAIAQLLVAEETIRGGQGTPPPASTIGSGYWADLMRLLLGYRVQSAGDAQLAELRKSLTHPFFDMYLSDRQVNLESR